MGEDRKGIATKTLNNVSGLILYDMNDEEVLIGMNNEKPEKVELQYDEQGLPYVEYYGVQYLDEFMVEM